MLKKKKNRIKKSLNRFSNKKKTRNKIFRSIKSQFKKKTNVPMLIRYLLKIWISSMRNTHHSTKIAFQK